MSLRGAGPRRVGNLVIPIIPLYSLSFPKLPQGSLVPSPLNHPPVGILEAKLCLRSVSEQRRAWCEEADNAQEV